MAKSTNPSKSQRYGYVYHFVFTRPTDDRAFHYVGQHVGSKIDLGYFGSGFRLRQMYRKYGRDGNVVRTRLMWCYSKYELDFAEIVFIDAAFTIYGRDCLNLNYGGGGGRKARASVEKQRESLKKFYDTPEGHLARGRAHAFHTGRSPSAETRARLSESGLGKKRSAETCAKISAVHLGRKCSQETCDLMVESWRKRPFVTCPHCDKTGVLNLMNRWHFDNCKLLTGVSRMKPETQEKRKATIQADVKSCPHCGLSGTGSNMTRYHFDNCKKSGWLL